MAYNGPMRPLRYLLTLLLLSVYVGQSLAAVGAPCFMMNSTPTQLSGDMADMDHAAHHMASMEEAVAASDSCCEGGGFCSMSHCQSVVALPDTALIGAASYVAVYRDTSSFLSLRLPSGSLYRPPISR
jgi:hypothetical protein